MTSAGDHGGVPPIDPDFAGLFRPEDLQPDPGPATSVDAEQVDELEIVESPAPEAAAEPTDEPGPTPDVDPVVEPPADAVLEPPAQPRDPVADTGRLFRSQGVTGHDEAVLALSSDHFGRLKTLRRSEESAPEPATDGTDAAVATLLAGGAAAEGAVSAEPRPDRKARRAAGSRRAISAGAVYIVIIGATLIAAFLNALIADGDIGWPTGVVLVASSVYCALTVRREDDAVAFIVPPIAFLVAALTAGQLFLGSADSSILNRAVVVFFTLADNWIWIIGATVAALVIVLVRRRRS